MITIRSPFIDFIALCEKDGACPEAMEWMNKQLSLDKDQTFGDAIKAYVEDEKIPSGWHQWNIEVHGKDLDEDCRGYFLSKINKPMDAVQVLLKCEYLTTTEDNLLKAKFPTGTLPTVDKEMATGVVVLAKDRITP